MATRLGDMAVGSTVKFKVNGKAKDFIVVHHGKPSSVYDDSCNGTWFLMKDIYEKRKWHSSDTNDYANSTIHSYLNSTFLNLFESNIKNSIKQVKLPYRKGSGASTTVTSGPDGLSAKIFLLSATETSFNLSTMPSGEGAELAYFKGCADNSADSKRTAYLNGSATVWWLRSPICSGTSSTSALGVASEGDGWLFNICSHSYGIRPALILPSTLSVLDDGTVIGNSAPEVTSGAELGEKNAPFTVGYTVTDKDGDLMTVTEKLDGEVKATKASTPPTVVQVQTARNDSGDIPAWDTYPSKYEFFMPLTAKKAGLLLRSLEFRVKGYVPGTMRTVLRKYGSTTALADKFTDIIRGYNDVVLDMGSIYLEKGIEYQLYFAASNNFYPPSVQPEWVVENDYVDIATGSAYYGDDTTLIFSGTMVIVDNHLTESGASTAALTVDWLSEKAEYQQVLNGSHTVTLEVTDGILISTKDITFTKNVTGAKVSLTAPLTADDTITVAALTLEGSFPADMSLTVEMTNNGLDDAPVWENCTDIQRGESRAFVHHVFTNKTAARGFAFNYKVTVARGASGVGGTITMIGGVIG